VVTARASSGGLGSALVTTGEAVSVAPDERLAALLARAAELAVAVPPAQLELVPADPASSARRPPERLRRPHRACLETNLTRRGLWLAVAGGTSGGGATLGEDRLGAFTVEPGLSGPLTVTELEVITWLCSRWRELGDPSVRRVPLALAQVARDFGWSTSGRNLARIALALDRLRDTAITLRVWAPGERTARARRRFGLLADWQAGRPDARGLLRHYGWATLGDTLHAQLRGGHLTYLSWVELRRLDRPLAKRLFAFLEGERFDGDEKCWPIGLPLFATLGMATGGIRQARARLAVAAVDVEAVSARYARLRVDRVAEGHVLVARRTHAP